MTNSVQFLVAIAFAALPGDQDWLRSSIMQDYNPNHVPFQGEVEKIREEVYLCGDRQGFGLRGPARSLELIPLGPGAGTGMPVMTVEANHQRTVIHHYTEAGIVIREDQLDAEDKFERTTRRIPGDDEREYHYEVTLPSGNSHLAVNEIHNATGQLVRQEFFSPEGQLEKIVVIEYDDQGRRATTTRETTNFTLDEVLKYTYAENERWVEQKHYSLDGEFQMVKMLHTDEEGRPTREQYYNQNRELTAQLIHERNARGYITKTSFVTRAQGTEFYTVYKYDDHSYPVEVIQQSRKGLLHWRHFAYEFDHQGNWIRRVMYDRTMRNDRPVYQPAQIVLRDFTYRSP